ncbi:MAG: histidine kinase dimerization/phosphoacceptor domain-containing protein, partial [Actinomycetota bacterium]|nr:histidine kinase dimerization/phosphoacceptor domain-containing protein [Actinomycetota bacterium]
MQRGTLIDAFVCAALVAYAIPATTDPSINGLGTVLDTVFLPAAALPIMLRRRAPFAAACAFAAGSVISGIPTFEQIRIIVAIPAAVLIVFSLASRAGRTRALAGLAIVFAGLAFVGLTEAGQEGDGGVVGIVLFAFPVCAVIWAAGRIVLSRQRVADQLEQRSRELAVQREQTAALAVEVERARLAIDLNMAARVPVATMIELAEHAERTLGPETATTLGAFAQIERLGRESLNQMRSLLGVLRS